MRDADSQFVRWYDEYARRLLAWLAVRVPRSDVEDTAQEIWIKVAEKLATFGGGNFGAWLFEIGRNHLIDRSRRVVTRTAQKTLSIDRANEDEPQPQLADDTNLDGDEQLIANLERLRICLNRLEFPKSEIVRGWLSEIDYRTLAAQFGLTEAQVSNQFRTAKQQLRRCLEGSD